jgi:hypothetical protein
MRVPWIPLIRFIWSLNLIATALVIWRLYSLGLHKTYRYFLISMALSVARTAVLFPFSPGDNIYRQLWLATQPLVWLSYLLVVAELYRLVLRQYGGIYSLGRWFFFGTVALSVIISGLTVLPALTNERVLPGRHVPVYYYSFIERGLVTTLALFLLLLLVFVAWFSVPLSSNLLKHCAFYSAYFFANNVIMLYWNSGSGTANVVSVSRLSVGFICLMCWVFFLSRRGEDRIASLHLGRNAIAERKLLTQLENLNATLLRTARK